MSSLRWVIPGVFWHIHCSFLLPILSWPHSPLPIAGIMSDEEAQTIVDRALKSGSIEQRNMVAVVVGIAGSGKTWLISRLFRVKPPERYTSTGVAEQSLRGLMRHIAMKKSWEHLSPEEILKIFASFIQAGLPKADIASLAKIYQQPHTSSRTPMQEEYLMMTLLEDKPEKDIQKYLLSFSKVAPLVVHFSSGCVPNGCFANTVSCLISTYSWEVCRTKHRKPECLAHNIVTLSDPTLPVSITVVNYTRHLEIYINTDNVEEEHLSGFCLNIRTTNFEAIKENVFKLTRFEDLQVKPAFLCPCDPSHVATICEIVFKGSKTYYMKCSERKSSQGCLQEKHLFWFQDKVQNSDQKPIKLSDLLEDLVNISHKWYDLGLRLELEEGTLKAIKSDHPENSQHCLSEMLSTWLKVEPRETWHTLCAALRSKTVGEEKLASKLVAKYVKHKRSCI